MKMAGRADEPWPDGLRNCFGSLRQKQITFSLIAGACQVPLNLAQSRCCKKSRKKFRLNSVLTVGSARCETFRSAFSPSVSRRSRGRAFARQLKLDSSICMAYPSTEHLAFRCTRSKKFSFSLIEETQQALSLSRPFHLLHGLIMNCIIKSEKTFFRSKNKTKERMSAWKCGSYVKSVREEQTDWKATSIRPCSTTF